MKITREIETSKARYSLDDLNDEQFSFLVSSVRYYAMSTSHHIPDKNSIIGELVDKLERMKESSVTIIS